MIRFICVFAVDTHRAIVLIVYIFMIYIYIYLCRNIALSCCGDFEISMEWESSMPKQPGKSWNQTEDTNGYLEFVHQECVLPLLLKPYIFPVPAVVGPENKS